MRKREYNDKLPVVSGILCPFIGFSLSQFDKNFKLSMKNEIKAWNQNRVT